MSALITSGTRVLPEWIDYNGHLMDGYYFVAFSDATEAILEALGFGPTYRDRTGRTIYTVEGHLTFLREVTLGTVLTVETRIVDHDAKRIHVVHEMRDEANSERLATAELMFIHVDQSTGKVEPMPEEHASRVAAMAAEHAGSELPPEVGRSVGIRRGTST